MGDNICAACCELLSSWKTGWNMVFFRVLCSSMGWKIGSVVMLRMDVTYWLWVLFCGCVIANDGVWSPDSGTSLVVMTQSIGVMGVTTGFSDVIGHIGLLS